MNIYLDEPLNTSTQNMKLANSTIPYETRKVEMESIFREKQYTYTVLGFIGFWSGASTRIVLNCNIHGNWQTNTINVLEGGYCKRCSSVLTGNKLRCTKEEFVIKANKIHTNKYTYEKFEYIGSFVNSIITCPIHGDFSQTPTTHLSKTQCPKCSLEENGLKRRSNTEEFIAKAKAKHGDNYSYDKFVYVKSNHKGIITCKLHGDYPLTPNTHLTKKIGGCIECGMIEMRANITKNDFLPFVEKANLLHNNAYTYDKFVYINVHTKGIITCKIHDNFEQTPGNHISGKNKCPDCVTGGFKPSEPAFVYLKTISSDSVSFTGYGITGKLAARMRGHRKNIKDAAHIATNEWTSIEIPGHLALDIENTIKLNYTKSNDIKIPGFIKENAPSEDYLKIKRLVETMIYEYLFN